METSEFDNRRQHQRSLMEGCEVQLKPMDAALGEAVKCSYDSASRDISDGGMRIWSDRCYPLHTRLLVSFECNVQEWPSVTTRVGVVMWVSPLEEEGRCLLGIKFGDDDPPESAAGD
ncbi:hypothetical protein CKO12_04930 [Chromatium okenii]|uniref:PilZ domain-containing protein n=1 Tax=Chromatium okenii TaxID=61644 RepID=UPI0019045F0D|nr:PilZ domain-containing protein [Chromatium okenii]MBK1641228.1 hypothetical protein [Chromatium okenii]